MATSKYQRLWGATYEQIMRMSPEELAVKFGPEYAEMSRSKLDKVLRRRGKAETQERVAMEIKEAMESLIQRIMKKTVDNSGKK